MKASSIGLALIMRFEGFSPVPYCCPAGRWTIGYGHVIQPKETASLRVLDRTTAKELLARDVAIAELAVSRLIAAKLNQQQFDALTSFTFNLGAAALQRSTLRRVINRGEREAVPHQLQRWVWGGGRKLTGLSRRRAAEAALYIS